LHHGHPFLPAVVAAEKPRQQWSRSSFPHHRNTGSPTPDCCHDSPSSDIAAALVSATWCSNTISNKRQQLLSTNCYCEHPLLSKLPS